MHDVAELNDPEATIFLEVKIYNFDPALVVKEGVTVKDIKLSPVCIAVNLLVYDYDPVNAETYMIGISADEDEIVLKIIGAPIWSITSILTSELKIGVAAGT